MIVSWNQTKFRLWAVAFVPTPRGYVPIGLDLVAYESTFALNEVPTATLRVAIGYEAATGVDSFLHAVIDRLRLVVPVQVWLHAVEQSTGTAAPVVPWPDVPFMAFEGYAAGSGFTLDRNGTADFTLELNHWLVDLSFSSAVSRSSHVTNPSHYYSPAGLFFNGAGGLPQANLGRHFVANTMGAAAFSAASIVADFWAFNDAREGLLGFLLKLTEQDLLQVRELNLRAGRTQNFEARAALSRFEPAADAFLFGEPTPVRYRYGVPLAMRVDDLVTNAAISRTIAQDVMAETLDGSATVTLWDKLVGNYRAHFLFDVVPMVSRALAVPVLHGLRRVWQTITTSDYNAVVRSSPLQRPLRGVGVLTGMASAAGGIPMRPGAAAAGSTSIGGYWENASLPGGMVRFFAGPPWLGRVQSTDLYGFTTAAPNGVSGSALFPGAGGQPIFIGPAACQRRAEPILTSFARSLYVGEALAGRTATVSGRPRFDIAPGSSVAVEVVEGSALAAAVSYLYGTVAKVTVGFDAEAKRAYSNILLTHTRNEAENRDDATSIASHPLWRYTWRGAPLVDHPLFGRPFPPEE